MDLAIQPGRPRRSSFTQHLHRVLHLDKAGNRRQSDVFPASAELETKPASFQQTHSRRMSEEPICHNPIGNKECGHQPHAPLRPTNAVSCETEPRFYTTQAFPPGSLERSNNSSSTNEAVAPGKGSNVTQKKDRRATMRLEADRLELEKRLLKLEQAEKAPDSIALRRESRRLTKKQPLGSSSRASSASADETRKSLRFSSVFSRRSSRSRSSSRNEGDNCSSRRQSIGSEVTVKDELSSEPRHSTASPVPNTLPVRLGAAISKGLAVTNGGLLSTPIQSAQPQVQPQPDATSSDTPISSTEKPTLGEGTTYLAGHGVNPHDGTNHSTKASLRDSHVSSDLDRASFAATLKLGRGSDTMQTERPQKQEDTIARRKPLSSSGINHGTSTSSNPLPTPSLHPSMTRNTPIRSLTENMSQRHSKKFTSSPLAGAPTVNALDRNSGAASIDSINLRAPTADPTKRTSGTKFTHTLRSSRALDRPNGKEIGARGPPLHITNNKTSLLQSTNLPESSSGASKPNSKSGDATTSYHTRNCSVSTVDRDHKTKTPYLASSLPLRKEPRQFSERTGQNEFMVVEPPTEKARSNTSRGCTKVEGHLDVGEVSTKQNAPAHGARISNVSLSTNLSHDQGSEEYNTADEAMSDLSQSRDEVAPASPASTPHQSAQDPFEKDPKREVSSIMLPRHKGTADKVNEPNREQPVTKLFVICCNCNSWHDMPSEVYGRLSPSVISHSASQRSRRTLSSSGLLFKRSTSTRSRSLRKVQDPQPSGQNDLQSAAVVPPPLAVKCCWCEHHINRTCCKAWTTAVQLCEKQF